MFLEGMTAAKKWRRGIRAGSFVAVALVIWGAYFSWRPPAPMLGLRHVEHWGRGNPKVSLSFDDGPHPLMTPLLLASLRRADVKATFFVVGDGLRLYPELARRMVRDGHRLANHSQYHNNLTRLSPGEYEHEVETCFAAIRRTYAINGVAQTPETRLFRPPGGGLNRDVMSFLYRHDVTLAWWSNNVGDWSRPPAWKIADGVKSTLHKGDIILLHDAGAGTPQAVPAIVKFARRQGITFEPMPESLD